MSDAPRKDSTDLALIRAIGLHKTYRSGARHVHALRGVDLEIIQPGFYAIMGPSGSGKSTLLHLLAGLDRPDEGSIDVAGCQVARMSEAELTMYRRHRIGIVFQQYNLIPTLTALDNVTLPGLLDGMPATERTERGTQLLKSLGLLQRLDHRPDALSGGEQQRVAIARALLFEPRVLLADEPTGNLDSTTGQEVITLLKTLAHERDMTVLLVTHEQSVASHCRCVFPMRDGRVESIISNETHDAGHMATRTELIGR